MCMHQQDSRVCAPTRLPCVCTNNSRVCAPTRLPCVCTNKTLVCTVLHSLVCVISADTFTGHRSQVTGHRSHAGHRSQVTDHTQVTGHRSQVTGHRSHAGHRSHTDHSSQATGIRLLVQTAHHTFLVPTLNMFLFRTTCRHHSNACDFRAVLNDEQVQGTVALDMTPCLRCLMCSAGGDSPASRGACQDVPWCRGYLAGSARCRDARACGEQCMCIHVSRRDVCASVWSSERSSSCVALRSRAPLDCVLGLFSIL